MYNPSNKVQCNFGKKSSVRERTEPVNDLAKRLIRIYNTLDLDTQTTVETVTNHTISVSGHDIMVDYEKPFSQE